MEEQKREFKGIWIPKEVWLDERLNALEKIIYMEIDSLNNNNKGCYAGNEYLAKFCQCSESKVTNAIGKLKELGFIEIVSFDGRHRLLKIKRQPLKIYEADSLNLRANNIIDDIIINNNISDNKSVNVNNKIISNNDIKKLTKKQLKEKQEKEEQEKINNLINDFTTNTYIKELLMNYVEIRKQKGVLTYAQLMIILEDLRKECGTNEDYMISCIRKAIAGGWSQIVFIENFKSTSKSSYNSADNTANHFTGNKKLSDEEFEQMSFESKKEYVNNMALADMTKKQKEFFHENCLARDENGNLLKF